MRRSRLVPALSAALALFAPLAVFGLASSCGARSELYVWEAEEEEEDAGTDAPPDVPEDSPPDVPEDVPVDVPPDGLPPCEPDLLYIYLVTSETDLYRYRPDNADFDLVGNLNCPSAGSPFSMGVARTGTAYVVYNTGELFRVSTVDASCEPTGWIPGTDGFDVFGMGFAIDDDMMGETLHVAEINFGFPSEGLATIDTETFELDYIGPFSLDLGHAIELTSSPDGNLYGYFLKPGDEAGGYVVEIDKHTATILTAVELPIGDGGALAFAQLGGDFYVFTTSGNDFTTVTWYDPDTGELQVAATLDRTVVGAGVTTCNLF